MGENLSRLTLHHLRIFRAVASHRSFTAAGAELQLTQSAVSVQIRELGRILGASPFELIGKKVHLTAAGRLLEVYAARIDGWLREMTQDFATFREDGAALVRIGASTSLGTYYLPALLAEFAASHPQIKVTLVVENSAQIEERLLTNEFDLGFIGTAGASRDIVSEPFLEDELFFCCSPGHPLAGVRAIGPGRLAKEQLIIREPGSATRATMEAHLSRRGIAFPHFMELGSVEAIKQVVMSGLGIGYFSAVTVRNEISAGWLVRLRVSGLTAGRAFYIVRHRLKKETAMLGACVAFAKQWQSRADESLRNSRGRIQPSNVAVFARRHPASLMPAAAQQPRGRKR
jgi:DNA-binding transcriptional LysR family regulator